MTIANVSLTNTFDEWRTITNQTIIVLNDIEANGNLIRFASNTSSITVSANTGRGGTIYISANVVTSNSDTSTVNIASARLANTIDRALSNLNTYAYGVTSNVTAAYGFANGVAVNAAAAFGFANTVNTYAYSVAVNAAAAFGFANTVNTYAYGVNTFAYGVATNTSSAYNFANTLNTFTYGVAANTNAAFTKANSAYALALSLDANNVVLSGIAAFDTANAAFGKANGGFTVANSSFAVANAAFGNANATLVVASAAFGVANAAFGNANATLVVASAAFGVANAANSIASAAFGNANATLVVASAAFGVANVASSVASAAFGNANATLVIASAAFGKANTALQNTTGTLAGDLTISGNIAVTGVVDTASANIKSQVLTDAATISWNLAAGQIATVTLGGSRTLANPTNLRVGIYILHVIQDGAGNRGLSFSTAYKWTAGVAPPISTSANARDIFSFVCDGTNLYGSFIPDVR